MNSNHFEQFESAIRRHVGGGDLGNFELARHGKFVTYYAPFDAINAAAKVVLVGITPGITQAQNALVAARRALEAKVATEGALLAGKRTGAFSGPLRANLVDLLDRIELNAALGIASCGSLFDTFAYLLHTTSVLPFPVLKDGANYDGKPFPLDVPFLAEQVERHFVPQVRILRDAVFVPLGPVPAAVLKSLSQRGLLEERRVLDGLPHPSPANRERIDYFMGRKPKERLSVKTNPESIDRALARLLAATYAHRSGGNAASESASISRFSSLPGAKSSGSLS